MIYAEIHNKRFKLYCNSRKIRNPQLTDDERKYIMACVDDILRKDGDKGKSKTEFVAKNLNDYGIKVIDFSDYNTKIASFILWIAKEFQNIK